MSDHQWKAGGPVRVYHGDWFYCPDRDHYANGSQVTDDPDGPYWLHYGHTAYMADTMLAALAHAANRRREMWQSFGADLRVAGQRIKEGMQRVNDAIREARK